MITESTILDAVCQINRARKRRNVWIVGAGTELHIAQHNRPASAGPG